MQVTAETGYEGKFDFPLRASPPELVYLLATVPRTGSTYFSHLLWRTGCLGAPLEYCNFEPAGPWGHASSNPALQSELWSHAVRHRTSANGVFGLKAFPLQLQTLQQGNPALLGSVMRLALSKGSESRVIQLRRRDRTAHAISYARAMLSGIWRSEQETSDRDEPAYSAKAVQQALGLIDDQESAWTAMYRDLNITPLEVFYEDVLADPSAAVMSVARFLGVTLDPSATVEIPEIRQQSQSGADRWKASHEGERQA